ncbi:hypothetical protein B0H13DRAFT_2132260, partial [Mycena leptocephala]
MASQLPHGNPSPIDPSWRRNGYQIQNVPSAVQSYVRIQATMSPLIRGLYLPEPLLSVLKLAEFEIPPMAPTAAAYKVPSGHNWFSEDAIHSDLDLLTTEIRVPPPSLIAELKKESRQRYLDGAESICMPGTGQKFPLWTPDLWSEYQVIVKPNVDAWVEGIEWLGKIDSQHRKEVNKSYGHSIPWPGLEIFRWKRSGAFHAVTEIPSTPLQFTCRGNDARLILYDINKATPDRNIKGMNTAITTKILAEYSKSPRDYNPEEDKFLQRFGRSLEDGSEFVGIFHVHENHWVGSAVDLMGQSIEFGDP